MRLPVALQCVEDDNMTAEIASWNVLDTQQATIGNAIQF